MTTPLAANYAKWVESHLSIAVHLMMHCTKTITRKPMRHCSHELREQHKWREATAIPASLERFVMKTWTRSHYRDAITMPVSLAAILKWSANILRHWPVTMIQRQWRLCLLSMAELAEACPQHQSSWRPLVPTGPCHPPRDLFPAWFRQTCPAGLTHFAPGLLAVCWPP